MINKLNKKTTLSFVGIALFIMLRLSLILNVNTVGVLSVVMSVLLSFVLSFFVTKYFLTSNKYSIMMLSVLLLFDPLAPVSMKSPLFITAILVTIVALILLLEFKAKMQGLITMTVYSFIMSLVLEISAFSVVPMMIAVYLILVIAQEDDKKNQKLICGAICGISASVLGVIASRIINSALGSKLYELYMSFNLSRNTVSLFEHNNSNLSNVFRQNLKSVWFVVIMYLAFCVYFFVSNNKNLKGTEKSKNSKKKKKNRVAKKSSDSFDVLIIKIILFALTVLFLIGILITGSNSSFYAISAEPIIIMLVLYFSGERKTVSLFDKTDEFISKHFMLSIIFIILYAGAYSGVFSELYEKVSKILT